MPTIKVEEVTRRTVEVEVQFPIYSKHDLMPDDYDSVEYRRWDADGTLWTIHRMEYPNWSWNGGSVKYEIEKEKHPVGSTFKDGDSMLGLGNHACTAAEFAEVLREAREFLAGIDGIKGA